MAEDLNNPSLHAEPTPRSVIVERLGRMPYAEAFSIQQARHAEILAGRTAEAGQQTPVGRLLLVEHDPVITVSKRAGASDHLLASESMLAQAGVAVEPTDRGGDITYHGPGQIVVYPIVDLNRLKLRLHDYMRLLEETVIRTIALDGIRGVRDPEATGVWVPNASGEPERKIAAFGVRVRRWVTMHGLALNVATNLEHFNLIVPCGLPGRPVTSLQFEIDSQQPSWDDVADRLIACFGEVFGVEVIDPKA